MGTLPFRKFNASTSHILNLPEIQSELLFFNSQVVNLAPRYQSDHFVIYLYLVGQSEKCVGFLFWIVIAFAERLTR